MKEITIIPDTHLLLFVVQLVPLRHVLLGFVVGVLSRQFQTPPLFVLLIRSLRHQLRYHQNPRKSTPTHLERLGEAHQQRKERVGVGRPRRLREILHALPEGLLRHFGVVLQLPELVLGVREEITKNEALDALAADVRLLSDGLHPLFELVYVSGYVFQRN